MATREMMFCFALSGLTATAIAQTAPAPETWTPISRTAQTITGRVTFSPERDHLPERKVVAAGPRWPDAVQARGEEEEGDG